MAVEPSLILTNSEKRVSAYKRADAPTNPGTVTPLTPLSSLNLNWRERDLPEKVRTKHVHRLHPYLGKFIPQLVEIFLRKYFAADQTVLDPFVGSGTTLIQANELGIHSIGYDVSAFNVLLCRAKCAVYDARHAKKELMEILEAVRDVLPVATKQQDLWPQLQKKLQFSQVDSGYLRLWYAPQALQQLLTYRRFIDTRDYLYKDMMRVVLSRAARSARLTTHFHLDFPKEPQTTPYWCYKHSRTCTPTTDAYKFLHRYTFDTLERIEEFSRLRTSARIEMHHADSRRARFKPIDGVLTSPPYVGLIDYHEQHAYAYHLLGLKDVREREIGAAVNGTTREAKEVYVHDIAAVFRKAAEVMKPGGHMVIVAHDRAGLYSRIATLAGMKVEAIVDRHVNRRTGRRSNEFFESVLIWRKKD